MAKKESAPTLPNKRFILVITIFYLLAEFFYLVTTLGNLPILKDTISLGRFDDFNVFFNLYYVNFDICASTVTFITFCVLAVTFLTKGFPSLFTYITVFWSMIINALSSAFIYYYSVNNLYMHVEQIILVLPIILIFLSSTLLIDDLADLYRGTYHIYYNRNKRRLLNLRRLQNVEGNFEENLERIEVPKEEEKVDVVRAHSSDIVGAAEMAIPELKK